MTGSLMVRDGRASGWTLDGCTYAGAAPVVSGMCLATTGCGNRRQLFMERDMADREQSGNRETGTTEQNLTGRQQQERAASATNEKDSEQSTDADGGTASRPRGKTEDPDRTL
jgi:hypothetical protein